MHKQRISLMSYMHKQRQGPNLTVSRLCPVLVRHLLVWGLSVVR